MWRHGGSGPQCGAGPTNERRVRIDLCLGSSKERLTGEVESHGAIQRKGNCMSQRRLSFSDAFPNYDAWSQLRAIREMIDTVFTWRNSLHGEISDAEHDWRNSPGGMAEMAEEAATTDLYLQSVYRDASAVQAAVGALAPFLEGFCVHTFQYLGRLHGDAGAPSDHVRWKVAKSVFWNPRKPNGLIQGLRELRDALRVGDWLTDDRLNTLDLLFTFRNRSFHFAYEWRPENITAFETCVEQRGWGDDVAWAKSDGTPWIAYLNDSFLCRASATTTDIVRGFVKVASDRGGMFRADPGRLPGFGPGEVE